MNSKTYKTRNFSRKRPSTSIIPGQQENVIVYKMQVSTDNRKDNVTFKITFHSTAPTKAVITNIWNGLYGTMISTKNKLLDKITSTLCNNISNHLYEGARVTNGTFGMIPLTISAGTTISFIFKEGVFTIEMKKGDKKYINSTDLVTNNIKDTSDIKDLKFDAVKKAFANMYLQECCTPGSGYLLNQYSEFKKDYKSLFNPNKNIENEIDFENNGTIMHPETFINRKNGITRNQINNV